jgi:hypothetical protein
MYMKKLISAFTIIAICASFVSAATMPTSMSYFTGYIKGFTLNQNGEAYVIIDKNKPFTPGGSTYAVGNWTKSNWCFYLGNVNSTSQPTGAYVKTLIAALSLGRSVDELWYFNVGAVYGGTGNNWITSCQPAQ